MDAQTLSREQRLALYREAKAKAAQPRRTALARTDTNAQRQTAHLPKQRPNKPQTLPPDAAAAAAHSSAIHSILKTSARSPVLARTARGKLPSADAHADAQPPASRRPARLAASSATDSRIRPHLDAYYSDPVLPDDAPAANASGNLSGSAHDAGQDSHASDAADVPNSFDPDALQTRLSEESAKAIRLQIELEARSSELASLRSLTESLRHDLAAAQQNHALSRDAEEALRSQVEDRERLIQSIKLDWSNETTQLKSLLSDKERLVDELGKLISSLRDEVEALRAQPKAYADVWIHQIRIEELEKLVESQSTTIAEKSSEIESLRSELTDAYKAIDVLEREEKIQEASQKRLHVQVEEIRSTLLSRETTIYVQEKDLSEKLSRIEQLEDALKETLSENEQLHKNASESSHELNDAYEALELLEAHNKDLEADISLMRQELINVASLEEQAVARGAETHASNTQVAEHTIELQKALKEALDENEILSGMILQLKSTVKSIRKSTADASVQSQPVEHSADDVSDMDVVGSSSSTIVAAVSSSCSIDTYSIPCSPDITKQSANQRSSNHAQTDDDLILSSQVVQNQITTLKFAHSIAVAKQRETVAEYTQRIHDIEANNVVEVEQWKQTVDEQKGLVEKLLQGVAASTERVKLLERQLEQSKAEYRALQKSIERYQQQFDDEEESEEDEYEDDRSDADQDDDHSDNRAMEMDTS